MGNKMKPNSVLSLLFLHMQHWAAISRSSYKMLTKRCSSNSAYIADPCAAYAEIVGVASAIYKKSWCNLWITLDYHGLCDLTPKAPHAIPKCFFSFGHENHNFRSLRKSGNINCKDKMSILHLAHHQAAKT